MGPRGFVHDRRYMLVTPAPVSATSAAAGDKKDAPEFRFLTQRQCPSLARVVVQLGGSRGADDAITITIFSTDDPQNKLITAAQPATNAPTARATVWGDVVQVKDMGDAAAAFLQALVDNDDDDCPSKGVRLVVQIPRRWAHGPGRSGAPGGAVSVQGNPPERLVGGRISHVRRVYYCVCRRVCRMMLLLRLATADGPAAGCWM